MQAAQALWLAQGGSAVAWNRKSRVDKARWRNYVEPAIHAYLRNDNEVRSIIERVRDLKL